MQPPVTFYDDLACSHAPVPESPLYTIRSCPGTGRSLFAATRIQADQIVLSTATPLESAAPYPSPATSPLAWLIQRDYRKECCAYCFAYNRGREFKIRVPRRDCGVVFCSLSCLDRWIELNGELGIEAWEKLEIRVRRRTKRRVLAALKGSANVESGEHNGSGLDKSKVAQLWQRVHEIEESVMRVRSKNDPSQADKKIAKKASEEEGDPDIMYYLLTATITARNAFANVNPEPPATRDIFDKFIIRLPQSTSTDIDTDTNTATATADELLLARDTFSILSPLFRLAYTYTGYNTASLPHLAYEKSYYSLFSIIPLELAMFLTTVMAHNLNIRAAHNAFSIRPSSPSQLHVGSQTQSTSTNTSDGPDSGEVLGWAVYPTASFFNHSCAPNLRKMRIGRDFEFYAARDIDVDEELCISYLGGEEETLDFIQRRKRLKDDWEFTCRCSKCTSEEINWNLCNDKKWELLSEEERAQYEL